VVAFGVVILRSARLLYGLDAERALAEEAAKRSRDRIRLLVEGTRDAAILMLDADGTVRSWNPGATRLYGYEEAEIVGRHFSKFFPPEDVVRGKPRLELAIAATEGRFEEEGWRVKKDGSRTWVSVILTALVGEDGVLRGFGKIVRDRTERKAIEERLRLAQLQVIQADKMETVGRLAAGVAHEGKNQLATILGGIDFLADRRPPDGVEIEVLREMRRAVDRANEIVVGLLDFSAPRVLALGHESVNRVIDRVLRFMKHQFDRGRVRVVRELTTGLPRISIDERKIEQVFVNVFLNALHAMPEGGALTIRTYARRPGSGDRTTRMRRFFGGVAAEIVTEIEDTGPGIPEERLRRVFEPFFTSRPTGEGTGLGLTVCKAIVEMHGGSIELANRDEGGARVTIVLNRRGEREHDEEALAAHR
jgi:PAS domain S-box-containing protein